MCQSTIASLPPATLQWYLDPSAMRLPPVSVPPSLNPQAHHILETLAVSAGEAVLCCVPHHWQHSCEHPSKLTAHAPRVHRHPQGLVEACTQLDPEQRPTFREVLSTLRAATGEAPTPRAGGSPTPGSGAPM